MCFSIFADQLLDEGRTPDEDTPEGGDGTVKFVLMSRGKQQLTTIAIPSDSEIVTKMRCREKEEEEERNRVKHLTLKMTERLELEEEAQELQMQVITMQVPADSDYNVVDIKIIYRVFRLRFYFVIPYFEDVK